MADLKQRISLTGDAEIRRALEQIGTAAENAFSRMRSSGRDTGLEKAKTDADALKRSLDDVGASAQNAGAQTGGLFASLGAALSSAASGVGGLVSGIVEVGVKASLAIGGVVVAAQAAGSAMASSAAASVSAIGASADKLGLTIEQFQRLRAAAEGAGVSSTAFEAGVASLKRAYDEATTAAQGFQVGAGGLQRVYEDLGVSVTRFAEKQATATGGAATAQAFFRALGVSLVTTGNQIKPFAQALEEARDAFSRLPASQQRTIASSAQFRTIVAELGPFLRASKADVAAYADEWDKSSRKISEAERAAADGLVSAQSDLSAALTATRDRIGLLFAPGKTRFTEFLTEIVDGTRPAILELIKLGQAFTRTFVVDNATAFLGFFQDLGRTVVSVASNLGPVLSDLLASLRALAADGFAYLSKVLSDLTGLDITPAFLAAAAAVTYITGALSSLVAFLAPVKLALVAVVAALGGLGPVAAVAGVALVGFWDQIAAGALVAVRAIVASGDAFRGLFQRIRQGDFRGAFDELKAVGRAAFEDLQQRAPGLARVLTNIGVAASRVGENITAVFRTVRNVLDVVAGLLNTTLGTKLTASSVAIYIGLAQLAGILPAVAAASFIVANAFRALGIQGVILLGFGLQLLRIFNELAPTFGKIGEGVRQVFDGDISAGIEKIKAGFADLFSYIGDSGVTSWLLFGAAAAIAAFKILTLLADIRLAMLALGLAGGGAGAAGALAGAAAAPATQAAAGAAGAGLAAVFAKGFLIAAGIALAAGLSGVIQSSLAKKDRAQEEGAALGAAAGKAAAEAFAVPQLQSYDALGKGYTDLSDRAGEAFNKLGRHGGVAFDDLSDRARVALGGVGESVRTAAEAGGAAVNTARKSLSELAAEGGETLRAVARTSGEAGREVAQKAAEITQTIVRVMGPNGAIKELKVATDQVKPSIEAATSATAKLTAETGRLAQVVKEIPALSGIRRDVPLSDMAEATQSASEAAKGLARDLREEEASADRAAAAIERTGQSTEGLIRVIRGSGVAIQSFQTDAAGNIKAIGDGAEAGATKGKDALQGLGDKGKSITEILKGAFDKLFGDIEGGSKKAAETAGQNLEGLKSKFADITAASRDAAEAVADLGNGGAFSQSLDQLRPSTNIEDRRGESLDIFGDVEGAISDARGIVERGVSEIATLINGIEAQTQGAWSGLTAAALQAWTDIVGFISDSVSAIGGIAGQLPDIFAGAFAGVADQVAGVMAQIEASVAGMVASVQAQLAALRAEIAAVQAEAAAVDSGGGEGFAAGGYIRGPGTATSDSIPAWLSHGEFVTRAAAVDHYGVDVFRALNNMAIPLDRIRRFAVGGLVNVGQSFKAGLPAFANGGLAASVAASLAIPGVMMPVGAAAAGAASASPLRPIALSIFGEDMGTVLAPAAVASKIERFATAAKLRRAGAKASWDR